MSEVISRCRRILRGAQQTSRRTPLGVLAVNSPHSRAFDVNKPGVALPNSVPMRSGDRLGAWVLPNVRVAWSIPPAPRARSSRRFRPGDAGASRAAERGRGPGIGVEHEDLGPRPVRGIDGQRSSRSISLHQEGRAWVRSCRHTMRLSPAGDPNDAPRVAVLDCREPDRAALPWKMKPGNRSEPSTSVS